MIILGYFDHKYKTQHNMKDDVSEIDLSRHIFIARLSSIQAKVLIFVRLQ